MVNKELEALLKDPLVDTRLQAARALSDLETFDQGLFLLALGDGDWRVRKEAIGFFMAQPDAVSRIGLVIDQLHHPDNAGLRNAAIEILISLGPKISKAMLARLDSENAEVRKFIIDILGEICHAGCSVALLKHLQDEDENVRYAVVETLGKLGSPEAIEPLLELLQSAAPGLQFVIFEALTSIGKGVPAARILSYADNTLLRRAVLTCLGKLADPAAIPVLLQALSDPMRKNREVGLVSFGQLIKSLSDKDCPEVDPQSDQVIGQMYDYLQHENLEFQRSACYILSLFPDAGTIRHILPLLAEEELRDDVVAAARLIPQVIWRSFVEETTVGDDNALFLIYLLGELRDPLIEKLALAALQSENPQYRYVAVTALGKIGACQAIVAIGDLLADGDSDVCKAASDALSLIGQAEPSAVIKTVSPYLEAAAAELRLLAVRTLGGLTTDAVEKYLLLALKDVDPQIRCEALRGLAGHCSPRLFSGLSLALTDEIADVRRLATIAIGGFPPERSTPVLQHALDDEDPWVRMEAVRSLKGGDPEDVQKIIDRGLSDDVGLVVIAALETAARILQDAALPMLQDALEHKDLDVCSTAVELLFDPTAADGLLNHSRAEVRLKTVQEYAKFADRQYLLMLESQLEREEVPQVRQAIEGLLRSSTAGI